MQEADSPLIVNCDAIVNCLYVNTWEGKGFIVILDSHLMKLILQH